MERSLGGWQSSRQPPPNQGPQIPPSLARNSPVPSPHGPIPARGRGEGEGELQCPLHAHPLSLQCPFRVHLGLGSVPRGPRGILSPSVPPWRGLDTSPAWPLPFPSLLQRDLRRGNSAALRGVSNAQPKLGSAQSQTGSSKPSPAPGAARNACPAQPGASGQTEQTKPNHTFHKINPLLLLFL